MNLTPSRQTILSKRTRTKPIVLALLVIVVIAAGATMALRRSAADKGVHIR